MALGILATWVLSGFLFLRFNQPLAFGQDHLFLLLHGRLFLDWPDILTNAHLGFPGRIDLLAFPFTDITQRVIQLAGTLATGRVIGGAHVYVAAIMAANFAAAYAALFIFVRRRPEATLGALAFALLPFVVMRAGGHDYLAACYTAPLGFILLYRVADLSRHALPIRRLVRDPVSWCCAMVVATSGFYFTLFTLLLLAYGGVGLALLRRDWRPFRLALAAAAVVAAMLLVALLPFMLRELHQGTQFPARHIAEQAIYGTRIADILRVLDPFSPQFLDNYRGLSDQAEGGDFWPGPALSCFALLVCLFAPLLAGRQSKTAAAQHPLRQELACLLAGMLVVFLLVSVPYGLGMVFNVLVSPLLRAQNRIAPFFGFAAIVLALWAWRVPRSWLCRRLGGRRGARVAGLVLALLVLVNSVAAIGVMPRRQRDLLRHGHYREEVASLDAVLAAAQRGNLRNILQMPIIGWPEQPPQRGFDGYGHMRPFILSRPGSPMNWSYGLTPQAVEFGSLLLAERNGPRDGFAQRIACLGFDALLLERLAYSEEEAEAWDQALRHGGAAIVTEDRLRRFYRLPSASGCIATPLPRNEWLPVTTGSIAAGLLGPGWHQPAPTMTWGTGVRHLLRLPAAEWGAGDLRIDAVSWVLPGRGDWQRSVRISAGGQELGIWRFNQATNAAERSIVIPRSLLPAHGMLDIAFTPSASPSPAGLGMGPDSRQLGLGIVRLRFSTTDGR